MITLKTSRPGIDLDTYLGRHPAIVVWPKNASRPAATVLARDTIFSTAIDVSSLTASQSGKLRDILSEGSYSAEWCRGAIWIASRPIADKEKNR